MKRFCILNFLTLLVLFLLYLGISSNNVIGSVIGESSKSSFSFRDLYNLPTNEGSGRSNSNDTVRCKLADEDERILCENEARFPDGFIIGVATAAYQIEGAYNEDGKGQNIWDNFTHAHPDYIADGTNGDVACDSYHKFQDDLQNIIDLGVDFYRFSLSWSRLLPQGEYTIVNEAAVSYYQTIIDELLNNKIMPVVTLHHFDIPQPLSEFGGWLNPLIVDYFGDFCRFAFERFGDKVKIWITINEPVMVVVGYSSYWMAPGINAHGVGDYLAAHNIIKAHARAYHIYDDEFRRFQKGYVGITQNSIYCMPASHSERDKDAAETCNQFYTGLHTNAIFSQDGDYPDIVKKQVDQNSQREGRQRSRLPKFTEEEIQYIKGSADFLGLNHYTSRLTTFGVFGEDPSWQRDSGVNMTIDPIWPSAASSWLKSVPEGFRGLLNWIKKTYNNPIVLVTECGFSDDGSTLEDDKRIKYYQGYLRQLLKAIYIDGCNVKGFTAWSLMDNFEWMDGYTKKFGLYHVDFSSDNRTRVPKKSVKFWQELTSTRQVPFR